MQQQGTAGFVDPNLNKAQAGAAPGGTAVPVTGGYGPAAAHAANARLDAQMASAAAHAGDYGTAIKKELESVGERIGQAVSSGSAHPGGLATVPGVVGGIGGAPSAHWQAVGAQAAMPVPAAGTLGGGAGGVTQQTTTRVTEYGAGGAPAGRGY